MEEMWKVPGLMGVGSSPVHGALLALSLPVFSGAETVGYHKPKEY